MLAILSGYFSISSLVTKKVPLAFILSKEIKTEFNAVSLPNPLKV